MFELFSVKCTIMIVLRNGVVYICIYILGLVVAVMDHEHFRLKLLYKQKKDISSELKKTKTEAKYLQVYETKMVSELAVSLHEGIYH